MNVFELLTTHWEQIYTSFYHDKNVNVGDWF